jgi:LytR cell envelope-related transcriptional attenuator
MAGTFYYASSYFRDSTPEPGACTTQVPTNTALQNNDVSLNVYNSTSKKGLAAAAANDARDRGFKVKAVSNDPKRANVKQVAQIRYGPEGAASATLVRKHVPQAVLVNDKRKGDTVDLVLGAAWKGFGSEPATPTPTLTQRLCPTVTVTQ